MAGTKSQQKSKSIKTKSVWSRKGTPGKSKRMAIAKSRMRAQATKSRGKSR